MWLNTFSFIYFCIKIHPIIRTPGFNGIKIVMLYIIATAYVCHPVHPKWCIKEKCKQKMHVLFSTFYRKLLKTKLEQVPKYCYLKLLFLFVLLKLLPFYLTKRTYPFVSDS